MPKKVPDKTEGEEGKAEREAGGSGAGKEEEGGKAEGAVVDKKEVSPAVLTGSVCIEVATPH